MNHRVLLHLRPEHVEVEIWRADELEVRRGLSSELDEMWSYVHSKAHPRWGSVSIKLINLYNLLKFIQ